MTDDFFNFLENAKKTMDEELTGLQPCEIRDYFQYEESLPE
jgi:hypothetical protein